MKTNNAGVESQTFNGAVEWGLPGSYFKLLTAAVACQVELFNSGVRVLLAPAVRRGFYQRIPDGFDRIKITNSGSQLIEFLAAPEEGGSDAFSGSLDVTSPLDGDNADAKAALGATGLVAVLARLLAYNGATFDRLRADNIGGAGALRMTERGFTYGASYQSITTKAANTPDTIFAPGSNPNGAIVWSAGYMSTAAASFIATILAKAGAAPATVIDGEVILGGGEATGTFSKPGRLPRPVVISANKGLYRICSQLETGCISDVQYTLL